MSSQTKHAHFELAQLWVTGRDLKCPWCGESLSLATENSPMRASFQQRHKLCYERAGGWFPMLPKTMEQANDLSRVQAGAALGPGALVQAVEGIVMNESARAYVAGTLRDQAYDVANAADLGRVKNAPTDSRVVRMDAVPTPVPPAAVVHVDADATLYTPAQLAIVRATPLVKDATSESPGYRDRDWPWSPWIDLVLAALDLGGEISVHTCARCGGTQWGAPEVYTANPVSTFPVGKLWRCGGLTQDETLYRVRQQKPVKGCGLSIYWRNPKSKP